jgi:hypothetical protein
MSVFIQCASKLKKYKKRFCLIGLIFKNWITLFASSPVQTQVNNNFTTVHFLYVLYMYDVLWIII